MTKIDARSNPVTIAHVDDVAEWSKLLLVRATLGAGFRHQSSGVGSNPTGCTHLTDDGRHSDASPES